MPKKLLGKLHDEIGKKKKKKKWSNFASELLELAGDDPGKKLPEFDKGEKMKPVRLRPGKKEKKAAEKFMKAHGLTRKEMLGYAFARGWELYKD